MLTIRNEQLAAFRRHSIECFKAELVLHLLRGFPGHCAAAGGEPGIREFAGRVVERALACGIERPTGITIFAELLLQYGESFERSPVRAWALSTLSNQEMPGDLKVEAIRDRHEEESGGRILVAY